MIFLITPAETNGGILQFSVTFANELSKLKECILFIPKTSEPFLPANTEFNFRFYNKIKSLNSKNSEIKKLCKQIAELKPEHVIFLEDSILMQQMCCILSEYKIPSSVVIHDIVHHPSSKMTLRQKAVEYLRIKLSKKTVNKAKKIILLSENSRSAFVKLYPRIKAKPIVFKLGAHVPVKEFKKPPEMNDNPFKYFLFFGRIDKYKGIESLCKAYSGLEERIQNENKLIIAGKGNFSQQEKTIIEKNNNILIIHRFIEDSEMLWLIKNSQAVVLPYIEASQSGVIPIAYYCNRPVIVRNLHGLVESVEENKTAAVFQNEEELKNIFQQMACNNILFDVKVIQNYFDENFCWNKNLKKLMEQIDVKQ